VSASDEPSNGQDAAGPEGTRLDGGQLAAIANALSGLHRRYFGRGATRARAYQVNDDLLLVELRDAYLTVERTLIDRGQVNTVRQTRLTFQQAMFTEFLDAIERATGRKVRSYASETITSPEAILEIFYLEPFADVAERLKREAAEDAGQLDRPYGGIPDDDEHPR
jgi:uncharacterized protein YbcI